MLSGKKRSLKQGKGFLVGSTRDLPNTVFPDTQANSQANSSLSSLLEESEGRFISTKQNQCKRLMSGKFRDQEALHLSRCTISKSHLTWYVAIGVWGVLGLYDMCKKLLKNIMKR